MTDDSINGSKSASLFRNRRRKRAYLATTTTRRKAFTRESDGESGAAETPSFRPRLPPGTRNYITREGVDPLKQRLKYLLEKKHALASASAAWTAMEAEQRKIESAIRRLQQILGSVVVAEIPPDQAKVGFGATVIVRHGNREEATYCIVGVEEAVPERGSISWISPLARALLSRRAGDKVLEGAGTGFQQSA
jgi:transcription elongation factor GreB